MDVHRLLTRREIDEKNARLLAELAMDAEPGTPMRPAKSRPAGDPEFLRGLPAVGVPGGFGGAQRHSKPGISRGELAERNVTGLDVYVVR